MKKENYFTWLNNYGFFPKVTEIEIEYVFDNVKSILRFIYLSPST